MATAKKGTTVPAASVTFYPAEGVWRDSAGKPVERGPAESVTAPAFDAPRSVPTAPDVPGGPVAA